MSIMFLEHPVLPEAWNIIAWYLIIKLEINLLSLPQAIPTIMFA